ncbi:peptide transporter family 2-like [Adelges cooleyi]|uniref:peptide transporter family 2-like n=1 Tax=Adelges cooleyi TaxID=133065 RepID=UPI002180230E|nr:peptide transporter family 2-like [Adelges cooleyi]
MLCLRRNKLAVSTSRSYKMDELHVSEETPLKYPKSVWLIVLCEMCERFSYYGLKTVLVLYLTKILMYTGDESTIIYHSFVFVSYFMPVFGAILADTYWGKYKTIVLLSLVYVLGNVALTASSILDTLLSQRCIALFGLLLISTGTGGIKPCVYSFGGDQFVLPKQQRIFQQYSTRFVLAINIGALISSYLTPEFRVKFHCFGRNSCYPLSFGVPALLMITAIIFIVSGRRLYVNKQPDKNGIYRTTGCIFYALRNKWSSPVARCQHWLDCAHAKYTETEVSETKAVLGVTTALMAFPIFWALYEQQSSRWTLQATIMKGRLDYLDWTIKPDQMQMIIPLFGMMFLVLFDLILYPFLSKIGIKTALQKLALAEIFAVVSFAIAAVLQFKIFGESTVVSSGEGHINIYNGFDCNVSLDSPFLNVDGIDAFSMTKFKYSPVVNEDLFKVLVTFDDTCSSVRSGYQLNTTVTIVEGKVVSYFLTRIDEDMVILNRIGEHDDLSKPKNGYPILRLLNDFTSFDNDVQLVTDGKTYQLSTTFTDFQAVEHGQYNVTGNGDVLLENLHLIPATIYTLMVQRNGAKTDIRLFNTDKGNYLHILWQLPQFLFMISADVIFVVYSMEFVFSEAPQNMKSVLLALNFLTVSAGNLVVVIISAISLKNQAHEYILYCFLMLANVVLTVYLSVTYNKKILKRKELQLKKNDISLF